MTLARFWLTGGLVVTLASALWRAAPAVDARSWVPPPFTTLRAGGFNTITHQLPINVVFVGYEEDDGPRGIKRQDFLAQLSATSCTRKRVLAGYGLNASTGLCFDFEYNVVFADLAFEDALFAYLAGLAKASTRTLYQDQYNEQAVRSLTVTQNHRIDAAAAETWLAEHGADIGVNTSQYTVFFINWYGRSDFRFHVYDYRAEPEPDTGVDFGAFDEHAMIAWGGSNQSHRVWFYDLSAGPERRTANWNLVDADINFNSVLDYRMPPVWEYGNLWGYRPFDDLSGDLGKVTRYVAVNLLFATSPTFDPAISPPRQPATLEVDINVFADSGPEPSKYLRPALIAEKLHDLQPLQQFSADVDSYSLSGRARDVYTCFVEGLTSGGDSCFGHRLFNIAFGDLFLYFYRDHLLQYLEGDSDYEIPVFFFYSSTESPLDGFADDNWRDGTQAYAAVFNSDVFLEMGFGGTWTVIHEVGHHLGMSHPYDGYDSETDSSYFANNAYYFAGSGAQSRTVMNSIGNTYTFSFFDRDNMARYLTNTYINLANRLLAAILSSPGAVQTASALAAADVAATVAIQHYQLFDYAGAAAQAKSAYEQVLAAAAAINVQIEPQAWQADYRAKGLSPMFVDTIYDRRLAR